jgi:hypothetical protein
MMGPLPRQGTWAAPFDIMLNFSQYGDFPWATGRVQLDDDLQDATSAELFEVSLGKLIRDCLEYSRSDAHAAASALKL